MTLLAFGRPFWPLFLHVLGAMSLVGAVLAAAIVSWAGWPRPETAALRRTAFASLAVVGVPAYTLMRACAQWIYADEGWTGHGDPTWLGIGFGVADAGLLLLLVLLGVAFWWQRSGVALAARLVAGLSSLYLLLLAVAWLAMSGKWG